MRVEWAILSLGSERNEDQSTNLMGIFNKIAVPSLPAQRSFLINCKLVFEPTDVGGTRVFGFRVLDPDMQSVAEWFHPMNSPSFDKWDKNWMWHFPVPDFPFQKWGEYIVQFESDGERVGGTEVQIIPMRGERQ